MNRQSQQLVIAGVVAFLTSGIITLAGLSTAQVFMPPMDGGGTMIPPRNDGGYTLPTGGGGIGEMNNYQPPMGGGNTYMPPAGGGGGFQGGGMQGGGGFQGGGMPQGNFQGDFQNTMHNADGGVRTMPQQGRFQQDGAGFQRDGMDFQRDGAKLQKDGAGFRQGAPDFEGKEGAERSFRGGFDGKEGAERAGGRFERQPKEGFDEAEGGIFGKGSTFPRKGQGGEDNERFGRFSDMQHDAPGGFSDNGEQSRFGGPQTKPPADISALVDKVGDVESGELPENVRAKVESAVAKLFKACDKMLTAAATLEKKVLRDDEISTKEMKQIAKLGGKAEDLAGRVDALEEIFGGDYELPDALVEKYEAAQAKAEEAVTKLGDLYEEGQG